MLTPLVLAATAILYAAVAKAQENTGWTTWQNLGRFYTDPLPNEVPFRLATAVFASGNPMIAAVDLGGTVLTVLEARTGFWIRWYFLNIPAGFFPYVTATTNAARQPIVFYRTIDGAVWFAEVTSQGTGLYGGTQWTEEENLGRPTDAFPNLIYATRFTDRRVTVCFTDSPTSTIRCRIRQAEGAWSGWVSSQRAPAAIGLPLTARIGSDHRIHFFAASADVLFELTLFGRSPMSGAWTTIGGIPGLRLAAPTVAANADGRLEVFARGSDGTLWHIYQLPGSSTFSPTWSSWETLGHPPGVTLPFGFATDAVAENDDRRLEVFVVAGDAAVWHIYQTGPSCCWSEWESLGRPTRASRSEPLLSELRVVNRRPGSLELFGLDQLGRLWTIYQQ